MSRIPPRSSRSPLKPPSTPTKARGSTLGTPSRGARTEIARSTTPTKPPRLEQPQTPKAPSMSIKEAIALRRAEAKKAQLAASQNGLDASTSEVALPPSNQPAEEEDILGRLSLRESIEKARSTGVLNIATRSLPCLPSALFEIHLSITPDPLKSVSNEPNLPPAEEHPTSRRGARKEMPAWFEAQDLTVLKAWNNEIAEVQHEISLFGGLKTVDLHKNKLAALPKTFADLSFLTVLDLSQNQLTELPSNLWSLPELTTLNLSNNELTSLPFGAPFTSSKSRTGPNSYASSDFFTPAIVRATSPLPKLVSLDVSHNKITSSAIDLDIPAYLAKLDLSSNPVGQSSALLQKLATLPRLKEVRFEKAEIGDDSLPPTLFSSQPFPALRLLDLSETGVTLDAVEAAFKLMKQGLNHDFTTDEPPVGVARILVGKRIIKEPWEIELERRNRARVPKPTSLGDDWDIPEPARSPVKKTETLPKEPPAAVPVTPPSTAPNSSSKPAVVSKKEPIKEAWEIEAEQGLFTEGGRRRARAAAAAAQALARSEQANNDSTSAPSSSSSISNPKYYSESTQTLTLPPSAPAPKGPAHSRSFSLAAPSASAFSSTNSPRSTDLALPAPTLPLTVIVAQPFADTLRVLVLANRRLDRSIMAPVNWDSASGFLPKLEELDLQGCNIEDAVTVQRPSSDDASAGAVTPPRSSEPLIPTLTKLFPSLRTLNLSYNRITDASLTSEALSALILQAPHRNGLRHLRLRGNRISDLSGFQKIAEMFKGNRDVPEWKLEELDVRDNEIGKLPPEIGLLPMDVLLVEGNVFRVPQRRVWEREGTKGLLSWLRGRIE